MYVTIEIIFSRKINKPKIKLLVKWIIKYSLIFEFEYIHTIGIDLIKSPLLASLIVNIDCFRPSSFLLSFLLHFS